MLNRRNPVIVAFLGLALFVSACSGTRSVQNAETAASNSEESSSGVDEAPSKAVLEELYWSRQDSARNMFTEADVDFMTGMISHHAQALVMSDLAPANGASPQIQTLAARIINAQKDEIQSMQQWLGQRGQTVPEVHISGTDLMIHGAGEHHMHMPGMLSPDQIENLANATGSDFDRLFLTYMIQHHKGAVAMVDDLFSKDGAGQDEASFKLAADIHVDQVTEIARMELMLEKLTEANPGE